MATEKQIIANRRNAVKGGRKSGGKNAKTLERDAVQRAYEQKVMEIADTTLLHSQLHLARGISYLWKIEKECIKGPRGGTQYKKLPPKIVTDTWEMECYLLGLIGDIELDKGPGATYYYLTHTPPNSRAIDSMLDRALRKATPPRPEDVPPDAVDANVNVNQITFKTYGTNKKKSA